MPPTEDLMTLVKKHLIFEGHCYRHCTKPAFFQKLREDDQRLVGMYVCDDGAVSRVIYMHRKPDLTWFKAFLNDNMVEVPIMYRDIRIATRHGWEVGQGNVAFDERADGLHPYLVREVYWSAPRVVVPPLTGKEIAFLCQECRKIFLRMLDSEKRLCPACSKKA